MTELKRELEVFTYVAVVSLLFGFIYFFTSGMGATFGLDADVGADLLAVLPGLFIAIIGVVFIAGIGGQPFAIIGFGAMGVGLAILLQEMYDAGIIVDVMLGGATLAQYETIIIILGLIFGAVAFISRRR